MNAEIVALDLIADLTDDDVFGDLAGVISGAVIGTAAAWRQGGAVPIERCYAVGVSRAVIAALRSRYTPGMPTTPPAADADGGADGTGAGVGGAV